MKICVIGGGNLGTLLSAEFAHKGHDVVIHTSNPLRWSKEICVYSQDEKVLFKTDHYVVTSDLGVAVKDAEQIWITYPSLLFPELARRLELMVSSGQTLVVVPGGGGAEFSFLPLIEKGCTLCGLQRVHSITRLKEYGASVYMLGRKPSLQIAAIPSGCASGLAAQISEMLDLPCEILKNYLTVTLTPSNPILHTTRLYSMFRTYEPGVTYDHNIRFYEEWTDEASEIMLQCDAELQALCSALPQLDLSGVRSLKLHYESDTPQKMTKKISGIPAFQGLLSPMKQQNDGWIPDFSSRYFTADFSFGLKVILDIGRLLDVEMPMCTTVWEWYLRVSGAGADSYFSLPIAKKDELCRLYLPV